mgnify:CR=1 FL=1
MIETTSLIGRTLNFLDFDIAQNEEKISSNIERSSFLVLGGAGSIGQAVTKEIFKRHPRKLHVVDISENNLVELVRDIRSSLGYIEGDFQTFALDINSWQYDAFIQADGTYDYVLNLSALKHVRSEKDPFTLLRMIEVNILNTIKTIQQAKAAGAKKYFCVSTDKAANPVNMMGGSKRIMEMFLMRESKEIDISTARFANVAFSDGSLLHGFNQRIAKNQPIVAPNDVRRYFVTPKESGELCLLSCLLGDNRDIFFPKLSEELHLVTFSDIARRYVQARGYEVYECADEKEARARIKELPAQGKWPCLFTSSDTTGEKDFEEFYTDNEILDLERFQNLGIVKNGLPNSGDSLDYFLEQIEAFKKRGSWSKQEVLDLFHKLIPHFGHLDKGRYLDSKM